MGGRCSTAASEEGRAAKPTHFRSGEETGATLQTRKSGFYNHRLPHRLGSKSPLAGHEEDWHKLKPELLRKQAILPSRECDM